MTVDGSAMRAAVELAAIAAAPDAVPVAVLSTACAERVRERPVRSLAAQATLSGVIGRLAQSHVEALLADAEALALALDRAQRGAPLGAEAVGVTPGALLREAGLAAARLG